MEILTALIIVGAFTIIGIVLFRFPVISSKWLKKVLKLNTDKDVLRILEQKCSKTKQLDSKKILKEFKK